MIRVELVVLLIEKMASAGIPKMMATLAAGVSARLETDKSSFALEVETSISHSH